MPVFFYIDPEFTEDPAMARVDTITLSYTFFEAKEAEELGIWRSSTVKEDYLARNDSIIRFWDVLTSPLLTKRTNFILNSDTFIRFGV